MRLEVRIAVGVRSTRKSIACFDRAGPIIRAIITPFLGMLATFCALQPKTVMPIGGVGTLVAVISNSAGRPLGANAYIAEDPHVTADVVAQGKAGTWADEKGIARLGDWRPGRYTLVIRAIGYSQEKRVVTLHSGQIDSVKVVLRPLDMTTQ